MRTPPVRLKSCDIVIQPLDVLVDNDSLLSGYKTPHRGRSGEWIVSPATPLPGNNIRSGDGRYK